MHKNLTRCTASNLPAARLSLARVIISVALLPICESFQFQENHQRTKELAFPLLLKVNEHSLILCLVKKKHVLQAVSKNRSLIANDS